MERTQLYRTIWRWHFYASLLVMPLVLVLATTGAAYLFKPQIDRWEERDYRGLSVEKAVSPDAQLDAALSAFPGAQFYSYRLPERASDAAMIHLALADGQTMRDIFVSPQGRVLGSMNPETRIAQTLSRIHGSLLAGKIGGWIVELAACWAIVMIVTGLYLWWPKGGGIAGVIWPRLGQGKRLFWRDLHAVTGFWVSGFALILLLTGLPWAGVWGDAFKFARTELGLMQGPQNWKTGSNEHAEHDHQAMLRQQAQGVPLIPLSEIVDRARQENMAYPVVVVRPNTPQNFGSSTGMFWTVKSETQNRPLVRSVTYDMATGKELERVGFGDKHVIDRAVNYGIAWHEGQLFGWINQFVGVMTALGLITLVISGFVMWRRRKPQGMLGAPPLPSVPIRMRGVVVITLMFAALLPLLAISLAALWLFDRFVLPHLPALARWLGMSQPV